MKKVLLTLAIVVFFFSATHTFAAEQVKVFIASNYGGSSGEAEAAELEAEVNAWLEKNSRVTITKRLLSVAGVGSGSGRLYCMLVIFYETK